MASNEIELTFIRCPSCKSLMPSTAHKCGMCGLNMDSDDEVQPERKVRLRQRSMTNVGNLFDSEVPSSGSLEAADEATDFSDSKDIIKPIISTRVREDFEEEYSEEIEESEEESEDVENGLDYAAENTEEPIRRKRKRRRRKKKNPGIDRAIDEGQVEESPKSVEPLIAMPLAEEVNSIEEVDEPLLNHDIHKTTYESLTVKPQLEGKVSAPVVDTQIDNFHEKDDFNHRNNMSNSNKLLGWFVNYSTDEAGKSYEIRLGKKFIGRQQLRAHDLLIPDSAISTPHCLLNAEVGKLNLQDLMSEQGTYIRQSGEVNFKKIDSTVQLNHGDILKLGSFELVVCLIPAI